MPEELRGHDIDEMRVLVFADGFEDRFWFINLPEQIYLDHQKYHLQVGMKWRSSADAWSYEECPVRNLLGCWDDSGPKTVLKAYSEEERPAVGYQAATIRSDDAGIHYEVRVTNRLDTPWEDVNTWVCFNSFRSPATGHRPYVRLGDRWAPFQDIPNVGRHCYVPVGGMVDEYTRTDVKNDQLVNTSVSFPGVVAWNFLNPDPLLTCHYSPHAVAVGSNQGWPCTDIFLWFGTIPPGQEVCRTGHVVIAKGDMEWFSEQADRLLEAFP